jgi:hypothetical protein
MYVADKVYNLNVDKYNTKINESLLKNHKVNKNEGRIPKHVNYIWATNDRIPSTTLLQNAVKVSKEFFQNGWKCTLWTNKPEFFANNSILENSHVIVSDALELSDILFKNR